MRIARAALDSANEKLARGKKIQVLVNNSDGKGNSYGSHLNFLITRRAWDNIFRRKIHYMLYLAAFQASSIVYTGQGKVGSENASPQVSFQISARADFFERLVGAQTTHNRPIVNSRDEALCGSRGRAKESSKQDGIRYSEHGRSPYQRLRPGALISPPSAILARYVASATGTSEPSSTSGNRICQKQS